MRLAKVKGEAVFASDMVHARSGLYENADVPSGTCRRPEVDTSKAEALPGVLTVLSSARCTL